MDDLAARAFVTQAVVEGLQELYPNKKAFELLEPASKLVTVVLDSYFKLRLSVPQKEVAS